MSARSNKKKAFSKSSDEKEAVRKMKELSKTFYDRNIASIPNKYRGLTDSKKEEDLFTDEV